jgi:hypothetical protein
MAQSCAFAVVCAGTFYPSTGMTLKQRCINTAATVSMRAMSGYFGGNYGPIREMADRQVLHMYVAHVHACRVHV